MATLPGIAPDRFQQKLSLALILFDGFTGQNRLEGLYADEQAEKADEALAARDGDTTRLERHTTVRLRQRPLVPFRKLPDSTFLLFEMPAGAYTVEVRSPVYVARDIPLALPPQNPLWPAYPDVTLADEDLPLDAPAQPAAYSAQRARATLQPSVKYPFPAGATLVRGTVHAGGSALKGASVRRSGDANAYLTGDDGEYVLFFFDIPGTGQALTIQATHPQHAPANTNVTSIRGMTVLNDITMV